MHPKIFLNSNLSLSSCGRGKEYINCCLVDYLGSAGTGAGGAGSAGTGSVDAGSAGAGAGTGTGAGSAGAGSEA